MSKSAEAWMNFLKKALVKSWDLTLKVLASIRAELRWLTVHGKIVYVDRRIAQLRKKSERANSDPSIAVSRGHDKTLAELNRQKEILPARLQTLATHREAEKNRLGLDPHLVTACAALLVLFVGFRMLRHKGHNAIASTASPAIQSQQTSSTDSQSDDTRLVGLSFDDKLKTIAKAAPPGNVLSPQQQPRQRFSDQMIELLKADVLSGKSTPQVNQLSHSSDPLVRQILFLEKDIVDQAAQHGSLEKEVPVLGAKLITEATAYLMAHSHTETQWTFDSEHPFRDLPGTNDPDRWNYSKNQWEKQIDAIVVDPGAEEKSDEITAPLWKKKADLFNSAYFRKCSMQKLEPLLHAAAIANLPGSGTGAEFKVLLGETLDAAGNVVITNKGTTTFHHCMIVVRGEESAEQAFASPFLGMLDQAIKHSDRESPYNKALVKREEETEQLPEISVQYRDTFAPGENVLLPACSSREIMGLTWLEAAVWSDEIGVSSMRPTNRSRSRDIAQSLHDQQTAADKMQAEKDVVNQRATDAQNQIDWTKLHHQSVHVVTGDGSVTYQFLVYPTATSENIVAPIGVKHVDVLWDWNLTTTDLCDDAANFDCQPRSRLTFYTQQEKPVPVVVRFLTRDYKDGEQPITMPVWPPPAVKLSLDAQAAHDAINAEITRLKDTTGSATQSGGDDLAFQLHLEPDPSSGYIDGWIYYTQSKLKIKLDGRIVDDPAQGATLQLVESYVLDPKNKTKPAGVGRVYEFKLGSNKTASGFTGSWTYRSRRGRTLDTREGTAQFGNK